MNSPHPIAEQLDILENSLEKIMEDLRRIINQISQFVAKVLEEFNLSLD